jgi:4-hydroxy-2-oxoglutarate aldolase
MQLHGIYCPITTPFHDGRGAVDKLAYNLEKLAAAGLAGYVLFGSSGEAPFIPVAERIELIKAARAAIPSSRRFIVGTGFESTFETIAFTKQAADLGADCALVLTPNYYKNQMNDEVYERHFVSVADKSPIPVILYNVPVFTGIDLSAKVVKKLSNHPNIIGIKDSTSNLAKMIELTTLPRRFNVLVGNAVNFLTGLFLGAQGAVLALCNLAAKPCVEIYDLYGKGDHDEARQRFLRVLPLVNKVIAPYGIPGIKAGMDMLGYFGGLPRAPLLAVDESANEEIRTQLIHAGLL